MRVRSSASRVTHFGRRLLNRGLIFQITVEYHCTVGIVLLNGDIQLCLRAGDGIAGVLQLFPANKIGITQRHTTVKVALRLRRGGFCTSIFACNCLLLIINWCVWRTLEASAVLALSNACLASV